MQPFNVDKLWSNVTAIQCDGLFGRNVFIREFSQTRRAIGCNQYIRLFYGHIRRQISLKWAELTGRMAPWMIELQCTWSSPDAMSMHYRKLLAKINEQNEEDFTNFIGSACGWALRYSVIVYAGHPETSLRWDIESSDPSLRSVMSKPLMSRTQEWGRIFRQRRVWRRVICEGV